MASSSRRLDTERPVALDASFILSRVSAATLMVIALCFAVGRAGFPSQITCSFLFMASPLAAGILRPAQLTFFQGTNLDIFANGFRAGVWANEYTGVSTTTSGKQFYKFNDANFDAISCFGELLMNC